MKNAERDRADGNDVLRPADRLDAKLAPTIRDERTVSAAPWFATVVAAAALLLAVAWGAWLLVNRGDSAGRRTVNQMEGGDRPTSPNGAVAVVESLAVDTEPVVQAMPFEGAESLLIHVTGPELEGVVDLMEAQSTEGPLLSI